MVCQSVEGEKCEIPFLYHGKYYDSCINIDNGGVPWCYHTNKNITNDENRKDWGICTDSSCPTMKGKKFVFTFEDIQENDIIKEKL